MKKITFRKKPFSKPYNLLSTLLFVVAFGAIGVILLFQSHAATQRVYCAPTTNMPAANCRPFFGGAVNGYPGVPNTQGAQVAHLESLIGHKLDVNRDYVQPPASDTTATSSDSVPLSGTPGKNEAYFAAKGYALNINWNPAQKFQDAESTADGGTAYVNSQINKAAANFANFQKQYPNVKVFLTPWHEMNLHTTINNVDGCNPPKPTWTTFYGTYAQFDAAWRNVYNIFKAHGVHNVIWTLGYSSLQGFNCAVPLDWPGGQYVNWIDYDSYDHGGKTWANTIGTFYNVLKAVPGSIGQQIRSKPWGVGEFGTGKNTNQQNVLNYWNDGATAVRNNTYPNLKLYLVFADYVPHTNIGALTDYDSSGNLDPDKQKAVNNLVDAIYGSSSPSPQPAVSLTAPSSGATVSGNVPVAATATVASGSITKLTLKVGSTILKTCTNTGSCSTTWNTAGLSNGAHTLTATATASDGKSASTSETVKVTNTHPITITTPTNLTSPTQTTTSITLAWHASTDSKYASSQLTYQISRNGAAIATTKPGVTSFTNTKLAPGTYYSYTVKATDPGGNASAQSAAFVQNTKKPNCAKPAAPQDLRASAPTATSVSLSWHSVPNPSPTCAVIHYVVERASVALSQPIGTSYTDHTVVAATHYTYQVLAVVTGNTAGSSSSVQVTTPHSTQPDPGPSTPARLTATAVSTTQVNLTWLASLDRITGIKQYEVHRNGALVGTTTTTSFGNSSLRPHTTYAYQVIAVSGGNKTASSATVHVTTLSSTSGGSTGSVTGSTGSGSGGASSIPILKGTTSVGSGSDTGQSTSQNPTAPGSATPLGQSAISPSPKEPKSHTVAYIAGSLAGILLLAGGVALRLFWQRRASQTTPYDPDLYAATVVRPNPDNGGDQDNQDKENQP